MTTRFAIQTPGLTFGALQAGEANDVTVIFLHGFPDSPHTFRHQVEPFVAAGYRVIVPTLRGYEPTSQPPNGDYSLMALAGDVIDWLDSLDIDRAHLVGHDWGAAIAYTAAARFPERFLSVTAMAVPPLARIPAAVRQVPRQLQRSWYMTFFQLRGISDRALAARDWWLMRRLWRTWSPDHTLGPDEWKRLRHCFGQPGVASASLAYYRQNATPPILLGLRSTPAMDLTEIAVPTLILNGHDDGCMDRRLFHAAIHAADYPAGVRHLTIDGAGHFLHLEQAQQVNDAILDHLAGRDDE